MNQREEAITRNSTLAVTLGSNPGQRILLVDDIEARPCLQ